jgi:hypothetical protein
MTEIELKRFNRGNEISKQLDYYNQQLLIVEKMEYPYLTITIEQAGSDLNRYRGYVNDDYSLTRDAVIELYKFIIKKLKTEFCSL